MSLQAALAAATRATVRTQPTTFTVKPVVMSENDEAQVSENWPTATTQIRGLLAWLGPERRDLYRQQSHDVTHHVLQDGTPYPGAQPGDQLVSGARTFYVELIEVRNGLTIYVVNERPGLK